MISLKNIYAPTPPPPNTIYILILLRIIRYPLPAATNKAHSAHVCSDKSRHVISYVNKCKYIVQVSSRRYYK